MVAGSLPSPLEVKPESRKPVVPKLPLAAFHSWLSYGWGVYRQTLVISTSFAAVFAVIGFVGLYLLVQRGLTPMVYPWAGAFMLVGPALLCGYFQVARRVAEGASPTWSDLLSGFHRSPPAVWIIGFLSALVLMIWLTDAAIIYGLFFGREPMLLTWGLFFEPETRGVLWAYFVFCTAVGSVLALIVFAISAFSVPLIFFQHETLTVAVGRSVRIVLANLGASIVWGSLLTAAIMGSILVFIPLFAVLFPVLAFASEAAYRQACET